MSELTKIAQELEARGAVNEAEQLRDITTGVIIPARVVEAIRLLDKIQIEASKDPKLVNMAARASLLNNQIQGYYRKRGVQHGLSSNFAARPPQAGSSPSSECSLTSQRDGRQIELGEMGPRESTGR
jgi:hypothetical protein